ncbi:hypothetical protein AB5I41_14465 [Sphingomonas sp. MMS24-JH45]
MIAAQMARNFEATFQHWTVLEWGEAEFASELRWVRAHSPGRPARRRARSGSRFLTTTYGLPPS